MLLTDPRGWWTRDKGKDGGDLKDGVCVPTSWSCAIQCPRHFPLTLGFPGGASGKEPACHCRRHKRHGFSPWIGKVPWRREWQPTPVFLPGESHRWRSLAGYSHEVEKSWTRLKQFSTALIKQEYKCQPLTSWWSTMRLGCICEIKPHQS